MALDHPSWAGQVHLLRGVDPDKDQSYFLASVPQQALKAVHFPLGALTKAQVRQVAAQLRVPSAARRSSAGICFIGGLMCWTLFEQTKKRLLHGSGS